MRPELSFSVDSRDQSLNRFRLRSYLVHRKGLHKQVLGPRTQIAHFTIGPSVIDHENVQQNTQKILDL